jgi:hypothetical protein
MPKLNGLSCFVAAAAVGMSVASVAHGQTVCNRIVGPDVIVGGLSRGSNDYSIGSAASTSWSASVGGTPMCAFSVGTTSCNVGNVWLNWLTASNTGNPTENRHPVIGQNIYRLKTVDGAARFEQIGQAWLKHGFTALSQNHCCNNCQATNGNHLGISCSDPYTASRNAGQASLGPKWQVNAHTGVFTYPPASPPGGTATTVARRLQVPAADLDLTSSFFVEGQYVASDDAASGNQNNNASYRPIHFTGGPTAFVMNLDGTTIREQQAIRAWKLADPAVTETSFQVPGEGLFIVSSKATDLGAGRWRYEFAVYNMNSDLSAGTFSAPVPDTADVSNIGFHDVHYTDGDGFGNVNISGADWTAVRSNNTITWSTVPFASNANGNAIRWGTLYNFRFDANVAPAASGAATLGMWKQPGSYNVVAQVPAGVPCYANCDGSTTAPALNVNDFVCFQTKYAAGDTYANCDGSTTVPVLNVSDFICFQTAYSAGCP